MFISAISHHGEESGLLAAIVLLFWFKDDWPYRARTFICSALQTKGRLLYSRYSFTLFRHRNSKPLASNFSLSLTNLTISLLTQFLKTQLYEFAALCRTFLLLLSALNYFVLNYIEDLCG